MSRVDPMVSLVGKFMDWLIGPAPSPAIVSPFAPDNGLADILAKDLYPEHDTPLTITRSTALRVPAVKRAHDIHCTVLAGLPWYQYQDDQRVEQQPEWLYNSQSGMSPRDLRWGVASDLFMNGWAAIGFELGADGYPVDAIHIPFGCWSVDATKGIVTASDSIPARYQQRIVAIPLGYGSSGLLTDARDSIQAARAVEVAYRDRVDNPISNTDLTITGDRWDGWTPEERIAFRDAYVKGRKSANGATSVKPDWITVDHSGAVAVDLFESARNGARLDIANHAAVPASLLEGSRQGGGTDIKYSGVQNGATRNELWDFGLVKYADAIGGRLSLDDVCAPGLSIRVDPSPYLSVPAPTGPTTSED